MNSMAFLKEALKSFDTTGAFFHSSRWLAETMLEPVDFGRVGTAVELGVGNGAITRRILERMMPDAQLTAFEINPVFVDFSRRIQDDRFRLIPESAEKLQQYFPDSSVDVIISSLPLANIPAPVKRQILEQSRRALKPGALFVQFQYYLGDLGLLKRYFPSVKIGFTPLNIPPAFVCICLNGMI